MIQIAIIIILVILLFWSAFIEGWFGAAVKEYFNPRAIQECAVMYPLITRWECAKLRGKAIHAQELMLQAKAMTRDMVRDVAPAVSYPPAIRIGDATPLPSITDKPASLSSNNNLPTATVPTTATPDPTPIVEKFRTNLAYLHGGRMA